MVLKGKYHIVKVYKIYLAAEDTETFFSPHLLLSPNQLKQSTSLLSASIDLPSLEISYQWNYNKVWSFVIAFFYVT